MSLRMNIYVHL